VSNVPVRNRVLLLVAAVGLAFAARLWLLGSHGDVPDAPIALKLTADFDPIVAQAERIRPLHETKRPIQPGDWLERSPEGGQTFAQFVHLHQFKAAHPELTGIDIQPLGEFDQTQQKLVERTAEFMELFFGTKAKILEAKPLGEIPESAQRMRNETPQVLTTWIMDDILMPQRRPDALATIALVTCDLWPGDLNWVFGQARLTERVGLWSLHRNGDPHADQAAFRLCLRRTLKTAVHETGHMLGIPHCAAYECCMNGSRSREENDRQPLEFCPECQPKIWWYCGADPLQRCQALAEFCEREGLVAEAKQFRKEWQASSTR
jgi:archaemetzincin